MQSLGIDLSTDPKKVWLCEIDWAAEPPRVTSLERMSDAVDPRLPPPEDEERGIRGVRDEGGLIAALIERITHFGPASGRVVGIDAPFGWPNAFVEAVRDWADGDASGFTKRAELRLRASDRFVQATTGLTPMSVSTDRIGSTAMLCAAVLSGVAREAERGAFDRARAADGLAEVYPAAALRMWTTARGTPLPTAGYKAGSSSREALLFELIGLIDVEQLQYLEQVDRAQREYGDEPIAFDQPGFDPDRFADGPFGFGAGDRYTRIASGLSRVPATQSASLGAAGVAVPSELCELMVQSDDALDAFVCALIARAVALGHCLTIDRPVEPTHVFVPPRAPLVDARLRLGERVDRARALQAEALGCGEAEGWIHVPAAGPLPAALVESGASPDGGVGAERESSAGGGSAQS